MAQRLSLVVLCLILTSPAFSMKLIKSKTGDHCKDQAYDWLYKHAGNVDVESVQKDHSGDKGTKSFNYWFDVKECKGYIVASTRASNPPCKSAHYGKVPKYVVRIWASTRSCRKILENPIPFDEEEEVIDGEAAEEEQEEEA